jgi:hypothetical protein
MKLHENDPMWRQNEREVYQKNGIRRALEISRQGGLKLEIGQIVGIDGNDIAHELKAVNGDVAIVWIPDQRGSEKEVLLNDLYDPKVAFQMAMQMQAEDLREKSLNSINN